MEKPMIVEYTIDKTTDRYDLDAIFESIERNYQELGKLRLLCNYKDIPSLREAMTMYRHLGDKLKVAGMIEKYAIVTDKEWIKSVSDLFARLWIGAEVKTFYTDEKEKAEEWLRQELKENTQNIEIVEFSEHDIVGLIADGELTSKDYMVINDRLDEILKGGKKINLIIDISRLHGMTGKAMIEDLKSEFKYYRHISKAAIVTKRDYRYLFDLVNFLTPRVEVESFTSDELGEAMDWFHLGD